MQVLEFEFFICSQYAHAILVRNGNCYLYYSRNLLSHILSACILSGHVLRVGFLPKAQMRLDTNSSIKYDVHKLIPKWILDDFLNKLYLLKCSQRSNKTKCSFAFSNVFNYFGTWKMLKYLLPVLKWISKSITLQTSISLAF